jgi:hypothetical protein
VTTDVGFLEDHAAVALGFLELYALTFDASWLADAMAIADVAVDRFFDPASGQFFDTAHDHEALITRPRDVTDNAVPSGNALIADLLLRLSVVSGEPRGAEHARQGCDEMSEALSRHPTAFGHLLGCRQRYGATEVALVGDGIRRRSRRCRAGTCRHWWSRAAHLPRQLAGAFAGAARSPATATCVASISARRRRRTQPADRAAFGDAPAIAEPGVVRRATGRACFTERYPLRQLLVGEGSQIAGPMTVGWGTAILSVGTTGPVSKQDPAGNCCTPGSSPRPPMHFRFRPPSRPPHGVRAC